MPRTPTVPVAVLDRGPATRGSATCHGPATSFLDNYEGDSIKSFANAHDGFEYLAAFSNEPSKYDLKGDFFLRSVQLNQRINGGHVGACRDPFEWQVLDANDKVLKTIRSDVSSTTWADWLDWPLEVANVRYIYVKYRPDEHGNPGCLPSFRQIMVTNMTTC